MAIYKNTPPIVTNGLVLSLDAANVKSYPKTGSTWNDLSGNRNNGTLNNSPTFNSANGGSIAFDGVNNDVTIVNSTSLNFTNAISICCWFKTTQSVDGYLTTKVDDSFYLCVGPAGTTAGKLSFFLNGPSGAWLQTSQNVNNNNWIYGVATYQNTRPLSIYVNGILDISSAPASNNITTGTNSVFLGRRPAVSTRYNGNISNIHFYNRALSAQEILQNYNALKSRFGL